MAFSVYTAQAWVDGSASTPVSAARLGNVETGIVNAHLMPAVRVYHNTTQSINSGTETTVAFNSERIDQAGGASDTMHDNATNNSRLTCRYAGVYLIAANITWASAPTSATILLRHQGTTVVASDGGFNATYPYMNISTIYPLAVNEYVELRVLQNSGGAINISSSGNHSPEFMMVRVA